MQNDYPFKNLIITIIQMNGVGATRKIADIQRTIKGAARIFPELAANNVACRAADGEPQICALTDIGSNFEEIIDRIGPCRKVKRSLTDFRLSGNGRSEKTQNERDK